MSRARSEPIKAPIARGSYMQYLFSPKVYEDQKTGKKTEKYEATFIFDEGSDLSALKAAAVKVAVEEWGEKAAEWIKTGLIKNPFLDGNGPQAHSKKTGELNPGMGPGKTFIRTTSQYQPPCVDRRKLPIVKADDLYSGCYVYPIVHIYAWENAQQGKGLSFGIDAVQFVKDGERLGGGGGGVNPDDFFEKIEDEGGGSSDGAAPNSAADLFG